MYNSQLVFLLNESTCQTHLQLLKLRLHCNQSLILGCVLVLNMRDKRVTTLYIVIEKYRSQKFVQTTKHEIYCTTEIITVRTFVLMVLHTLNVCSSLCCLLISVIFSSISNSTLAGLASTSACSLPLSS